jgi:hypothetical protein
MKKRSALSMNNFGMPSSFLATSAERIQRSMLSVAEKYWRGNRERDPGSCGLKCLADRAISVLSASAVLSSAPPNLLEVVAGLGGEARDL